MIRLIFLFCLGSGFLCNSFAQSWSPISVTGFNQDVIADGPVKNAMAKTSAEMDAIDPSNFVICSREFARASRMPAGYGLPDDRQVADGQTIFSLAPYGENNALYLFPNQSGKLSLREPKSYTDISILGLATEGEASLTITLVFADFSRVPYRNQIFPDWFNGPAPVLSGFGRVKRDNATVSPLYYEGAPDNPRMYKIDLSLPAGKVLSSIEFMNTSPGTNPQSNRAFIFAISGKRVSPPVEKKEAVVPLVPVPEKKEEPGPKVPPGFTLQGKVTEEKTGKPVQAIMNFAGGKLSVAADAGGKYRIALPDTGLYSLHIEAPGYIGKLEEVNLKNLPPGDVNFVLTPIAVGTHVNLRNVLFEQGSPKLQESSFAELDMVVAFMKQNPAVTIELAGHTDNRGSRSLNLKLSNERVNEVKKYLTQMGIESKRIAGKGYGGKMPLVAGNSEEARKLNRRVEFIITGS